VQIRVLAVFGAVALLLAGVGIHGLLSFVVSERRREIGVRMALGAQRGEILTMVLRRATVIAVGGLAAGMLVAFWAGRGLEAALAGVPATDLVTFVSVAGLVGLTTLVGSMIPAVRATRIDPVKAIRAE
jgi:ABC-type antimicrobial peptide transport system permease subunit